MCDLLRAANAAFADVAFVDNVPAVVAYAICCIYFELGGLQLYFGFPDAPPRNSMTSNGYKFPYNIIFKYAARILLYSVFSLGDVNMPRSIFQALPFLDEMRVILDWLCARTSLDMFMWIKLEWIRWVCT